MDAFEVLDPGLFTTVQDLGRYGYQRLGIPVSGALDSFALRVANLLVGNSEAEAGLEITLTGLRIKVLSTTVIAITGADLEAKVQEELIPLWAAVRVEKGEIISFQRVKQGCRAYLAVAGGIEVPEFMGSKSTYVKGRLGGVEGRLLIKGDRIQARTPNESIRFSGRKFPPQFLPKPDGILRTVTGPQVGFFTKSSISVFCKSSYQVTPMADRMGIRLKGSPLEFKRKAPYSIISEAVVSGCIQIPGDGLPIILLVEQTLGGYPKLGVVISADLWKIAQAKPGDRFSFKKVSLEEAILEIRSIERSIKIWSEESISI